MKMARKEYNQIHNENQHFSNSITNYKSERNTHKNANSFLCISISNREFVLLTLQMLLIDYISNLFESYLVLFFFVCLSFCEH